MLHTNILNNYQQEIMNKCIKLGSAGLSLKMGYGKTLISLITSLHFIKDDVFKKVLIIVPKTLIGSWTNEIEKYLKDFKYKYIEKDHNEEDDIIFFITTPDIILKSYKKLMISCTENVNNITYYNYPNGPLETRSNSFFYGTTFNTLIIDEIHKFNNSDTLKCKALGSIYAGHRFLLSGTILDEPNINKILGYNILINKGPNNIQEIKNLLNNKSKSIDIFNGTLIQDNNYDNKIEYETHIIEHKLNDTEQLIYDTLKNTIYEVNKNNEHDDNILSLITYIRQGIISPVFPIINILMDQYMNNNGPYNVLQKLVFNNDKLSAWLNDETSLKSSRITEVLKVVSKHKGSKIVIFTSFRTSVDIIKYFIPDSLTIDSSKSYHERIQIIDDYKTKNDKNVLILTYNIGAEGLNLQVANILIIVDFWWNIYKTNQAIARVIRRGQTSKNLHIYFFTSNTGIEKALFCKQYDKLILSKELENGLMKTKITRLKVKDILNIINEYENVSLLKRVEDFDNK